MLTMPMQGYSQLTDTYAYTLNTKHHMEVDLQSCWERSLMYKVHVVLFEMISLKNSIVHILTYLFYQDVFCCKVYNSQLYSFEVWFWFLLQHGGQRYHIKLEVENGILHQKLIFSQSIEELYVELHECVIFNDGTKSPGCSRPEYKNYVSACFFPLGHRVCL